MESDKKDSDEQVTSDGAGQEHGDSQADRWPNTIKKGGSPEGIEHR